jgi:predicted outer membrane protein
MRSPPFFVRAFAAWCRPMKAIACLALLMLAACGAPSDEKVAGVSQSEADALNDAAAMLDANAVIPVPVENVVTR